MQIKELGKAKAVLGERETFCYGQLEPCQGGKPTHEVIWGARCSGELMWAPWCCLLLLTLGLWLQLFLQQLKPWWKPRIKHRYGKGRIGVTLHICAPIEADENCNSNFGALIKVAWPVHKSTSKTEFLTKVSIVDAFMPTCPETHHQCESRG